MSRSIHRRALLRALCLPLLLVTIVACHRQDPSALNANELFFDETLASISPDATLPDLFYIGTEDGVVYAYDADQGTTRRWLTAFDRIYKVLRDQPADSAAQPHDGTTFWVGTRNMGVVRCQLQGDSLVMCRQYALPRSGRGTHYSVYDLHQDPSGLYVATSNGLFLLSPNDTMQALHASWEIQSGEGALPPLGRQRHPPFARWKNLVCASASGVLSTDTRRRQSHLLLRANCTSLSLSGDTVPRPLRRQYQGPAARRAIGGQVAPLPSGLHLLPRALLADELSPRRHVGAVFLQRRDCRPPHAAARAPPGPCARSATT